MNNGLILFRLTLKLRLLGNCVLIMRFLGNYVSLNSLNIGYTYIVHSAEDKLSNGLEISKEKNV